MIFYKIIFSSIFILFVGCSSKEQVVQMQEVPIKKDEVKKDIESKTIEGITEDENQLVEEVKDEFIIDNSEVFKLALIYPSKKVSKYAKSSINTILGYLSYKNIDYDFKVIDSINEDINSMQNAFDKAREEGIQNIIALFTPNSIDNFLSLDTTQMLVYLPLIKKPVDNFLDESYIFGSISYEEQIKKLLDYSIDEKYTMFYQQSYLGNKLKNIFDEQNIFFDVVKEVKRSRNYFKGLIKDYRLNNSVLFLNTDIVKSSLILSQLRVYDMKPKLLMATQINYRPSLISLTQVKDRKNFIVANSISEIEINLEDELNIFGSKIKYNWVEYSTLVGVNYLYDNNETELINSNILDNEVIYEPRLYKATDYGFSEIK